MTITTLPPANLNPAAMPWARAVDAAVKEMQSGQATLSRNHSSTTRAVGATVGAVSLVKQAQAFIALSAGAPTGLAATAAAYYDSITSNPEVQVTLTWTAPATYQDGTPMTPLLYEVWRQLPAGAWTFLTTVTSPTAFLTRQPFNGGAVLYRVRAQADNGKWSDFGDAVSVTMPSTIAILAAPSAPTVTTSLGMVIATWNGLIGGVAPPAGFRGIYAAVSTDGGANYYRAGPVMLFSNQSVALGPYNDGQVIKVYFRAIDAAGGISPLSAVATVTVVGVQGPQLVAGSVTTNTIAAGSIKSALIDTVGLTGITVTGGTIQTDANASRGVKLTGTGLQAFNGSGVATFTVDGATGAVVANSLTATGATISGAITATSGSITGTLTVSGTIQTATSGQRVTIDGGGITGYNAAGVNTFDFYPAVGYLRATSAQLTDGSFSGTITANAGAINGPLTIGAGGGVYTSTGTLPRTRLDAQGISFDADSGWGVTVQLGQAGGPGIMWKNTSGVNKANITSDSAGNMGVVPAGALSMYASTNSATDFVLTNDGSPRIYSNAILTRRYPNTVQMAAPSGAVVTPLVITDQGTIGTSTGNTLTMSQGFPRWQVDAGGMTWIQANNFYTQFWSRDANNIGMRVTNNGVDQFYCDGNNGGGGLVRARQTLEVGGISGNANMIFANDGGTNGSGNLVQSMTIFNRTYATTSRTTAGQRILVITQSGTLGQLTGTISSDYIPASSRQFKHDIVDWDGELEKLLSLRPVRFKYHDDYQPDDHGREHVGFIAEEVVEAGLEILASYNADGDLHGVEYANMTAGLLALAKRQEQRISALEDRLNALTPA